MIRLRHYFAHDGLPDRYVRLVWPKGLQEMPVEEEICEDFYWCLVPVEGTEIDQDKKGFLKYLADLGVKIEMEDGSSIPAAEYCGE